MARRRRNFIAVAVFGISLGGIVVLCNEGRSDGVCSRQAFEGDAFTVCEYDPRRHDFRLAWRDGDGRAYRGFEALAVDLGQEAQRVRFAMNAGMFDDNGAPVGLYVENGQELHALNTRDGPGNFHMMPNGVFLIDHGGGARVETSEAFGRAIEAPLWATQSGPMLVVDSALHSAFQENGSSRYVRNGVGVDDVGVAYFVISEAPVSFGRFARFFRDELGCRNALFLDGAVSGLWAPGRGRMDKGLPLGPLLIVSER